MSDQPQVLLFGPQTGKDLRRQYPELANVPEFKKLTLQEMLFVWHYANPTSPIASENNDRIRRTKAYAAAFKEEDTLREEKYQAGNFPDSVKIAIEKMRQYEDALRQARAEVYRQQEAGRQQAVEERTRIVREARERANDSIRQAKLEIARDVDEAKKALEAESERLAEEIARSLLAPPAGERHA